MIEFELVDETQNIDFELIDDTENIEFNLTDYDDSEIRELINDVDEKADSISSQVETNTTQIAQNKANITALNDRVDQIPIITKTSQITNDSGFIEDNNYVHTDNNYTTTEKNKLSELNNYDDAEIRQDIIDLKNNKANRSEIPDVSNFITKNVNDLINYYKKTETFTKQEVNDLISAISTLTLEVVQTLPTQDISTTTIYLVPKSTTETNDIYDEYIYVSNSWEHIGSTQVDLTNYYTKAQVDGKINFTIDGQTYTTVQATIELLINNFGEALSQKQDIISSSSKLPSDLVDATNQTNQFVTSEEITAWNDKVDYGATLLQYMRQNSNQIYYPSIDNKPMFTVRLAKFNSTTRVINIADYEDIFLEGGQKFLDYYHIPNYIFLDLSPYNTSTQANQLQPYTQLPDGTYFVTNAGKIWFEGAGEYYLAQPGEIIYKKGIELAISGLYGAVYYSYDTSTQEWAGGFFTTYADVQNMIEEVNPVKNWTVTRSSSATGNISLVNGRWIKKTRTAGITSGSCSTPNTLTEVPDDYRARFTLRTASTFTTFTVTQKDTYKIYFVGDDCANGTITMVANKYYDVQFEADGFGDIIGHVLSYTLPST